jgi:glucose-1-phosphate adenylyltransferase
VRLSRTIVAPQTHIPPGLVIGEDPLEDRRWFRRTTAGTVLVTQAMLERRANDRARSHAAPRLQSQFPAPQRFRPSLDNQNA